MLVILCQVSYRVEGSKPLYYFRETRAPKHTLLVQEEGFAWRAGIFTPPPTTPTFHPPHPHPHPYPPIHPTPTPFSRRNYQQGRLLCDKQLFEPMVVWLPTNICVTRPQWVNAFENVVWKMAAILCRPQNTLILKQYKQNNDIWSSDPRNLFMIWQLLFTMKKIIFQWKWFRVMVWHQPAGWVVPVGALLLHRTWHAHTAGDLVPWYVIIMHT